MCTSLVDEVDGLVWQESVADEACTLTNGIVDDRLRIAHTMKILVFLAQAQKDLNSLIDTWLSDVDLLETAHDATLVSQTAVVFVIGSGADEADAACFQIRFQHIGGIGTAVASPASANHIVNLVDVDDGIPLAAGTLHYHLDSLFEVTAELSACQHSTHIHQIDVAAQQSFRHLALFNACRQSEDQCRLAHARLSDMQRIVLLLATKNLDGALQLFFPADERIVVVEQVVDTNDEAPPGLLFDLRVNRIIIEIAVVA